MNPVIDNTAMLPGGVANITIPVDQLPAIQEAIIGTSVQGMIIFFAIGVLVGAVIAVLYMKLLNDAAAAREKEPEMENE
jgi:hypothetical protein